jgi:hypothetical protein
MAGAESAETREDSCDTHHYKLYSVQTLGLLGGKDFEGDTTNEEGYSAYRISLLSKTGQGCAWVC